MASTTPTGASLHTPEELEGARKEDDERWKYAPSTQHTQDHPDDTDAQTEAARRPRENAPGKGAPPGGGPEP
jgi:hypothetical protein